MGSSLAIFFQINRFRRFLSRAHKGEKPNNSFLKIPSENDKETLNSLQF